MTRWFDPAHDDSEPLAALHAAAFDDAWDAAAIAALLATPGTFAFFAPDGFVMVRAVADEAEILTLAVAPAARGRGRGRALVRAAAAHARGLGAGILFLEVSVANAPARALYAGLGFRNVGMRKGYYAGRDAEVLKAALPLSQNPDFA